MSRSIVCSIQSPYNPVARRRSISFFACIEIQNSTFTDTGPGGLFDLLMVYALLGVGRSYYYGTSSSVPLRERSSLPVGIFSRRPQVVPTSTVRSSLHSGRTSSIHGRWHAQTRGIRILASDKRTVALLAFLASDC